MGDEGGRKSGGEGGIGGRWVELVNILINCECARDTHFHFRIRF